MALNDTNKNSIAFKKLVGKAHTQETFAFNEESISSNVSISYVTIFAQPINPTPATSGLLLPYNNDGIIEKVKFELELIPDTQIGPNQSQGYRLKLPALYTTLGYLGAIYSGGTILNTKLGKLQIVPSLYGKLKPDGSTELDPTLYQTNGTTIITKFDPIDWILDPYNGVVFVQTPPTGYDISSSRPGFLEAFLFVGKYLDTVVSGATATVGGINNSVQFRNGVAFSGTPYFQYIPSARTVTIGTRVSGTFGLYSVSIGSGNTVSGNNGLAVGSANIANATNSVAINLQTSATGVQSFAGGSGTSSRKVSAAGNTSFNFSTNDVSQLLGHGANAPQSIILGGINNNISSINTGSVIIGGNAIKLNNSGYTYTTAVQNFAIFGSLTGGTTGDTFIVLDPITKKIRSRLASDVVSSLGTAKGPFFSIQYNKNGSFSGQTEFIFNETEKALTLGNRNGTVGTNSFVIGGLGVASGQYSVAIGDNSVATAKASFAGGTNTIVNGQNSIVHGESNTVVGVRSFAIGYNNTTQANDSSIIGGSGNTISSGNTGSVIIGGSGLTVTGTSYKNNTIVSNLAILGTISTGLAGDNVLVIDASTKKIKSVTQSSISGGPFSTVIIVTASTYNVVPTSTIYFIGCSGGTTGTSNVNLPTVPLIGQIIIVSDIDGDAFTYPINISGNGNLIVGSGNAMIDTNFGSLTFIWNGIFWSVVGYTS